MKKNLTDEQKLFVQSMRVFGDIILDDDKNNILIIKLTDDEDGTFNIVNINKKSIQRVWIENLNSCDKEVTKYYHQYYKNKSDIESIRIYSNGQIEEIEDYAGFYA